MYSVGPYFLGRYLAELPGAIIGPVVFGSIIYPIVGLNTVYAWKFPLFRKCIFTQRLSSWDIDFNL